MNIFLTGHGFIATALKRHFEGQGHSVYTPRRESLYDKEVLVSFGQHIEPDVFIHTSAFGNMSTQEDPYETVRANITLLHNLLEASKNLDYKAFINFSTSAIQLPTQTLYSTTKAMGEQLSTFYAKTYDKPIVNVRPFSVTGVGEQESHLIPTLIRAAYTGEEVPFVPEPTHDFVDIGDVVFCIDYMTSKPHLFVKGQTIELGTGKSYSNAHVLSLVEEVTGKPIKTKEVKGLRSYDSVYWVSKEPYMLDPKPLEQSINEMVEAYEKT